MATEPTTYRLGSSSLCCTPGIIRWAINGYKFEKDRDTLRRVVTETWGIPDDAADALLSGDVDYTVDDETETVIFSFDSQG